MADVTLEFIANRLERIQVEQTAIRADITAIRADITDTKASITVLGNIALRIERDLVLVKDVLGHLDNRLRKVEDA
jgi:uncharacterized protein (UPF0335 family)